MLCKLFFGIIVLTIVNIDLDTSGLTDHINDCVDKLMTGETIQKVLCKLFFGLLSY